ncbi:MAG TPA: hypothetical protein VNT26_03755, partial [Candidatus Sulfotelmatobacter sp.]|nr:hypothetical protein [Candidatus Sulfotelmatobacter sp.]
YRYNVEAAVLGCRSTRHPAAWAVGRRHFFPALRNWRLEAAFTGTLEAYLHGKQAGKQVPCFPAYRPQLN